MSDLSLETLTDKVSSLTEKPSSARDEGSNLCEDLNEVTALALQMKDDAGKSLSNMSREVQKTYEDMVDAVYLKFQADLAEEWNKMKAHLQVESALLAKSTRGYLLRRSSSLQNSLEKSPALFSSLVAKALGFGSRSCKSSSAGAKKTRRP